MQASEFDEDGRASEGRKKYPVSSENDDKLELLQKLPVDGWLTQPMSTRTHVHTPPESRAIFHGFNE